eukprot:Opistho-1_new@7578
MRFLKGSMDRSGGGQALQQAGQRVAHRGLAHGGAVAVETLVFAEHAIRRGPAEPDRAHGFVGAAAGGAGHAGHGHGELHGGVRQRAGGHGARHRLAHRAVRFDQRRGHTEQLVLGGVGVGDEAALEPVAGARDLGAGAGDQAAGAALGRGHHPAARLEFAREGGHQISRVFHGSGAPQGDDDERAEGGGEVVEQDAEAAARAEALEGLVGPGHGADLDHVEQAKQAEGRELAPEAGGGDQPQHQPERDHLVPHDVAGVGDAQVLRRDGAGPPAHQRGRRDQQPPAQRRQQRLQHQEGDPGPERAGRAGREAAHARTRAERDEVGGVGEQEGPGRADHGRVGGGVGHGAIIGRPVLVPCRARRDTAPVPGMHPARGVGGMEMNTGAILTAMMLGVLLTAIASWAVSGLYRRRMLALMRRAPPPDAAHTAAVPRAAAPAADRPRARLDLYANRRAGWRYLAAVSALSLLIGVTQSVLALLFVYGDDMLSLGRALTLGAVYAWPMALTWGLLRRWSWLRTLGAIGLYLLVMLALVTWLSISPQPLASSLTWLGGLVLIPVTVTLLIGASGRIRAVAPYLLPIFLLLAGSSVIALQIMVSGVNDPPRWLIALVTTVGAWPAIVLLALAPWLLLAWPAWVIARALARAYRAKRFSDLWYLLAAYWFVVLAATSLPSLQGAGLIALTQFIPWLWIPLAGWALRGWLAPQGVPPTLLVLRVFQQDAGVQTLFDRVVERWRLSGNTPCTLR